MILKILQQFRSLTVSLVQICKYLKIDAKIKLSSECVAKTEQLKRENRIFAICDHFKASSYINAQGGETLYDKSEFINNNIELNFISPIESQINYKQVNQILLFLGYLSLIY